MKWLELLFAWHCFWIALGPGIEWWPGWANRIYAAGFLLGGIGWVFMAKQDAEEERVAAEKIKRILRGSER